MHTLVDFTTHIKGVEYIISVLAIAGFILYFEILKPKPFRSLRDAAREDIEYLKESGSRTVLRTTGRMLAAPFIGLAYVLALPFVCAFAFAREAAALAGEAASRALGMAGRSASFGWRPQEAYLGGKKDKKGGRKDGRSDAGPAADERKPPADPSAQ